MHYFTADLHYNHQNICLGVSKWNDKSKCRKFSSLEEMNHCIVSSINDTVKEDDYLYILGDFAFGGYHNVELCRKRIRCKKVHLIYGNHDVAIRKKPDLQRLFVRCDEIRMVNIHDQPIILFHYACRTWNLQHHGAWQLYGHSHGSLPDDPHAKSMDVGFDVRHKPFSFDELRDIMSRKEWRQIDHHNTETI